MSKVVFLAVAVFSALTLAYTMRWQGATLYWAKKLAPDNPMLPRGMQDAITPPAQTNRMIFLIVLILSLFVFSCLVFKWYVALGAFLITIFASGFVGLALPKVESDFFRNRIRSNMVSRVSEYNSQGDSNREKLLKELIEQLDLVSKS